MNKQQEESDSEDDFGPKPTNTHNNGNTTDYRNVFAIHYSIRFIFYLLLMHMLIECLFCALGNVK